FHGLDDLVQLLPVENRFRLTRLVAYDAETVWNETALVPEQSTDRAPDALCRTDNRASASSQHTARSLGRADDTLSRVVHRAQADIEHIHSTRSGVTHNVCHDVYCGTRHPVVLRGSRGYLLVNDPAYRVGERVDDFLDLVLQEVFHLAGSRPASSTTGHEGTISTDTQMEQTRMLTGELWMIRTNRRTAISYAAMRTTGLYVGRTEAGSFAQSTGSVAATRTTRIIVHAHTEAGA